MSTPEFRSVNTLPNGSLDYGEFLKEYTTADPPTRLDMLSCTNEIDGLLFYADDSVATLTFFDITRTPDGKRLTGVSGSPSNYYIFSALTADIIPNFGSWVEHDSESNPLPDALDAGKPVKAAMNSEGISAAKKANLKDKILPPNRLPTDPNTDAIPVFLPVCLPLFKGIHLTHLSFDDPNAVTTLYSIHPLLGTWLKCVKGARYLQDCYKRSGWELVQPNGYGNDTVDTADLPVSLHRSGPKKQLFDTKVNNFKKAYSVQEIKDDEEDTSEDESTRVKKRKRSKKKNKKSKRKTYSSDEESSSDEASERFSAFLQMLEILLAVPIFDAMGTLVGLKPPEFTEDLLEYSKTAKK